MVGHIKKIDKVLVAVDLGPKTEGIIAYALWLAKGAGAEIELLYVLDYALTPPSYLLPYIEKEKAAAEESLMKWVERLATFGIKARYIIAVGRLLDTFSATIREIKADIIVLGHKSHVVRPSSSERLIKSLDVPMLVVRGIGLEKKLGSVDINRILCATDFSASAEKAFEFAKMLSEQKTELIVSNVVSSIKIEGRMQKWKDMKEADKVKYKDELRKDAENKMQSLLKGTQLKGIVCFGVPYVEINNIAVEKNVDLIIMGARGLSYIKGVLIGSVTESVVKSSPCPVMIVR